MGTGVKGERAAVVVIAQNEISPVSLTYVLSQIGGGDFSKLTRPAKRGVYPPIPLGKTLLKIGKQLHFVGQNADKSLCLGG